MNSFFMFDSTQTNQSIVLFFFLLVNIISFLVKVEFIHLLIIKTYINIEKYTY